MKILKLLLFTSISLILTSHLSMEAQYRFHAMGCLPEPPEKAARFPEANISTCGSPSRAIDLRANLPPVGFQGTQNSCVGWAAGYYYKFYQEKIEHPYWNSNHSDYQRSPAFVYNQINYGNDDGAYISDALLLLEHKGCCSMAEMPYDPSNHWSWPEMSDFLKALPYRAKSGSTAYIFSGSDGCATPLDIVKCQLHLSGLDCFVMSIPVYRAGPNQDGAFDLLDQSDYFYEGPAPGDSYLAGYHAVCVCGYDNNAGGPGAGGFLIRNSWGMSWGFVNRQMKTAWYDRAEIEANLEKAYHPGEE